MYIVEIPSGEVTWVSSSEISILRSYTYIRYNSIKRV